MSPNLRSWLIGATNALISGVAAAGGSLAAGATFKQTAIIVGTAAVVSFVKWMAQHPIPGETQ